MYLFIKWPRLSKATFVCMLFLQRHEILWKIMDCLSCLTVLWRRSQSYRNQFTDLQSKWTDWFLYKRLLRQETNDRRIQFPRHQLRWRALQNWLTAKSRWLLLQKFPCEMFSEIIFTPVVSQFQSRVYVIATAVSIENVFLI